MSKSIVITLIGDDRPGIVESISEIISRHNGQWIESRMANLSGKFAGILHTTIPEQEYDAFVSDMESDIKDLHISIELASSSAPSRGQCYKLELLGQDRPGIIHRISSALSDNGATVDDLESEVVEASMSGEKLFKATIILRLPSDRDSDELSDVLEDLANELIVDIDLHP